MSNVWKQRIIIIVWEENLSHLLLFILDYLIDFFFLFRFEGGKWVIFMTTRVLKILVNKFKQREKRYLLSFRKSISYLIFSKLRLISFVYLFIRNSMLRSDTKSKLDSREKYIHKNNREFSLENEFILILLISSLSTSWVCVWKRHNFILLTVHETSHQKVTILFHE
jgi:hypothetical protein